MGGVSSQGQDGPVSHGPRLGISCLPCSSLPSAAPLPMLQLWDPPKPPAVDAYRLRQHFPQTSMFPAAATAQPNAHEYESKRNANHHRRHTPSRLVYIDWAYGQGNWHQ
jgi:hypothetical protein